MNLLFEPLCVLVALVVFSIFVGIPAAYYFTRPFTIQNKSGIFVFVYVATLIGYSQLHLLSFLATQFLDRGMNSTALPVALASGIASGLFLFWAKERVFPPLRAEAKTLALFFVLSLLATTHVMLPVVIGKWEMAYATGDDASRWYMVVSYFQTHPFNYLHTTGETLRRE